MAQTNASADAAAAPRSLRLLERNIGTLGVVVFGVLCLSLSVSGLLPFSTIAGLWPGSNLAGIIAAALILCLVHAFTYAAIGSAAPRSGADYILSSRVLSAPLGFASSFLLVVFSGLTAGSLLAFIPKTMLPVLLQTGGTLFGVPAMLTLSAGMAEPSGIVITGTLLMLAAFVLSILDPKTTRRILLAGFLLSLTAWIIILYQLGTTLPAAFGANWDQFMGSGSYDSQVEMARTLGMVVNTAPGLMGLAGLTAGFWIFYGYHTPTYMAGEVKKPEKSLFRGSLIALLISGALFAAAALLMNRLAGTEWLSAESFLYRENFGQAMPWLPFYAGIVQPGVFTFGFVTLAWIFSLINLVQTYFMFGSRIILAYVDDQLAPDVFGYVHPTSKSPLVATLAVGILAGLGLADAAQGGAVVGQLNFGLFAAASQLMPVLALTLLPFLRKEWFAGAPALVQRKVLGIPLVTVAGFLTLLALLWLAASVFLYPGMGKFSLTSVIALVFIFGWGLAWFYVRRWLLRRQGVSIEKHFDSLES